MLVNETTRRDGNSGGTEGGGEETLYTFKSRPQPPPRRRKRSRAQEGGRALPYEDIREHSAFGKIFLAELDRQQMKLQYIADRMQFDRDRLIYRLNRPWVFTLFDILRLADILHLDPVEFVIVWQMSMRSAGDPQRITSLVSEVLVVIELLGKIPEHERSRAFRIVESVLMTLTENGDGGVEVGEVLSRARQKLSTPPFLEEGE